MKHLYDIFSRNVSKSWPDRTVQVFLGIRCIDPKLEIISIRFMVLWLADEIVDSFHGFSTKKVCFNKFKRWNMGSIDDKISLNPVLQSFQETVIFYQIDRALISQFCIVWRWISKRWHMMNQRIKEYIMVPAEVVGLMCLKVLYLRWTSLPRFGSLCFKIGFCFSEGQLSRDFNSDSQSFRKNLFS